MLLDTTNMPFSADSIPALGESAALLQPEPPQPRAALDWSRLARQWWPSRADHAHPAAAV